MTSDKKFDKGDEVEWKTHGTTTSGKVEEKITEDTEAAGRTVRSDKSGKDAVHKPDALDRKDD
ncbi:DUF2945 domain-containing protein [Rhodococcus sp. ZPP]|uniref:DUF2945 domain-containing protein n=1 Tax=Rhodococcus sp. ZPP TaxID=2749906 RepID=UPI001AD87D67|nr:DUF2945 domain-containing protein [Rhodococcus sp. ZPP]QTJ67100.1 DUF2945 domain-containing protein [Rhodococcus sp. ZPP]